MNGLGFGTSVRHTANGRMQVSPGLATPFCLSEETLEDPARTTRALDWVKAQSIRPRASAEATGLRRCPGLARIKPWKGVSTSLRGLDWEPKEAFNGTERTLLIMDNSLLIVLLFEGA